MGSKHSNIDWRSLNHKEDCVGHIPWEYLSQVINFSANPSYNKNNYEMIIRISNSFLNRSSNIMNCCDTEPNRSMNGLVFYKFITEK